MASYHCYLLLAAFSLFFVIQIVTPLRCFVCTTVEDGNNCTDTFNKTLHEADTCDLPTAVCVKQILPALGKYPESVHRICAPEDYCTNSGSKSKHCSACKEDLCNSSFNISPSFSILALILSFSYIYNNLMR